MKAFKGCQAFSCFSPAVTLFFASGGQGALLKNRPLDPPQKLFIKIEGFDTLFAYKYQCIK
jgi:hypothetical protein